MEGSAAVKGEPIARREEGGEEGGFQEHKKQARQGLLQADRARMARVMMSSFH
jgi:hypothetical protein